MVYCSAKLVASSDGLKTDGAVLMTQYPLYCSVSLCRLNDFAHIHFVSLTVYDF